MLMGGLRGLVTRLTPWIALLGASIATSRGKHIRIDIVLRSVPARLSRATAIVGQLAAAVISVLAVVGFLAYISIAAYRAPAVAPSSNYATKPCEPPARGRFAACTHYGSADL